ncbi:MAG: peptidylprolyl isomerase [Euzebyales bacterium]|nr:peptidylprolyl isomerase [Euzebyales bacterium]MBA3620807.1 peptidylprolyl isomerase [Euzebyales bacterium]
MSGKQAKRELRRQKEATRAEARRKHRQQTVFTGIVIAIIVAIGGVLIWVSARELTPAELAAQAASEAAAASENPSDAASEASARASEGAGAAVKPVTERPVACGGERPAGAGERKPTFDEAEQVLEEGKDHRAVVTTSCGKITVDLLEDRAPETVNSFVFLARQGFFDSLAIFRNATSIGALQTGSGTNDASWDVGYTIPDELDAAKAEGYEPGTLAMANAGPDTGGSQFFFVYNDRFKLPPQYAVFGKTDAAGRKVLARIGGIPTVKGDPGGEAPRRVAWIESVEILTD